MYLSPRKHGFDPRQMVVLRPRKRRVRYRFNWVLVVLLPMVILATAWFLRSVEPVRWADLMRTWRIHDTDRFGRAMVWGIVLCSAAVIWRIVRGNKKEDKDS